MSFAEKYGKVFESQSYPGDHYFSGANGGQSGQQGYYGGSSGAGAGKPPLLPSRDLNGQIGNQQPQYGAGSGGLNLFGGSSLPPRAPLGPTQQSLALPASSGSRIQNNRSSFGGMFELSNKIDRLGSGQRQQYPPPNYGPPGGQNDYRQSNHSLGPPMRSLQTINND